MKDKSAGIIKWIALVGCGFVATQIVTILFKGEAFCLNQGCEIVENLTTIPPLYINLAGFTYFFLVFLASRHSAKHPTAHFNLLFMLLLTGMAAEGMLISYQLFVAQTICSYCLTIFALVVLLNIIHGGRQLLSGSAVFLSILAVAATLNFGAAQILIRSQNLTEGTFAVKKVDYPASELRLFFSSNCPHCLNVLEAIEAENNCTINFNPIDRIDSLDIEDITEFPDYNPAINRLLLSLLNIKTIPVLLAGNENNPTMIKGERAIVDYLDLNCSVAAIDPYGESSNYGEPTIGNEGIAPEGECEIEVECPEDLPGQSYSPDGY